MEERAVDFVGEDCDVFAGGEVDDLFEERFGEDLARGVLGVAWTGISRWDGAGEKGSLCWVDGGLL